MTGLRLEALEDRALLSVTAAPDVYGVLSDAPLVVAAPGVLANDVDTTRHALTIASFTQPAHGTLALNPNGGFTYTPTTNFVGTDAFTYVASDGSTTGTGAVTLTVTACTPVATVFDGPRLASVSSTQGPLLNAVLGGLLGTNLNLTAVDWTGLASNTINGSALLSQLQTNLGVASPSQALTTNITLTQLLTAAGQVAQADGNTAELSALNALKAQVGPLTGTIQLGNLLQGQLNQDDLANANLNALDLATAAIQAFNFKNVATTPTPVTISGAELTALGLPATVGSAMLYAQVVEPPIITTGPAGTQFHSAAIRMKLDMNNLVGLNLNTSSLLGPIAGALGIGAGLLTVNAQISDLPIYIETASTTGTIQSINALTDAVTLQATPSVANVYIGNMNDSVFFNRTHVINPATDLTFANVGSLTISALGLINTTVTIQARDVALGQAPTSSTTLVFNPPYPAPSQTVGSSTTAVTNLATQLANNLQVQLSGNLGALLNPIVTTLGTDLIQPLINGVITPIVTPLLTNTVDPLLNDLGVGIGEEILDVDAVGMICPPIANNDTSTTPENTAVVVPVLANDAIEPGDTVTITATTQPAHGTDVLNADNTVTYTPTAGFIGVDTFTYTISDGTGTPSTATVTINVQAPAPVATDDTYSTPQGTTLTIAAPGVQSNDSNPSGGTLTSAAVTQPAHGTLTLNANGSFTYIPNAGFAGADSFTYDDVSNGVTSNIATVNLNVATVAPVANNDAYSTPEGATLTVAAPGVQSNDTNAGGGTLTSSVVTQPSHGTLTLNANGSITYVPTAGFFGTDTFTYHDSNGAATSNTATVTITIPAVAPVASNDAYSTPQGATLTVAAPGVQANDSNTGGGALTSAAVTQPAHGTLTFNPNGSFTYIPAAGFAGTDSFTYDDISSGLTSNVATVTLTASAVAPVANNDAYSTPEGTTLTIAAPGVESNDTNPGGGTLTASVVTQPAHGTLTLNGNGSFTYVPTAGFVGSDSFTYHDSNGPATSNTATVTLTVAATPAPVANNDAYSTPENAPLTVAAPGVESNDTSPTGKALTSAVVTQPAHGTVAFNANGSFTYTPTAGFVGSDTFTYDDSDGNNTSNTATVTVTVSAVAPVANNDTYSTPEGATLTIAAPGVQANDTNPGGGTITSAVVAQPSHGTVTLGANGGFVYVPTPGFAGTDSFTYDDVNGPATSNTATVTINVAAVSPVANNDAYSTPAGTTLTIAAPGVQGNDNNPGGGTLTSSVVAQPAHGTLTFNANGSFNYVPTAGFAGSDSFTYQDSNGAATSNTATVTLTVSAVSPVANNDTYSTPQNSPLTIATPGVQSNDTNPGGGTLTSTVVAQPAHGTLTFNPNGSFTYVPTAGFAGSDSFTYQDSNGTATSGTATVTLNVTAVAPVANNDTYSTPENATLTITAPGLQSNDTNPGGGTLTSTIVAQPAHGTLTLNANGSFTYVPTSGFAGSDTFSYHDSNGAATSNTATVTVNVSAVAPVANNDAYSTPENIGLTVNTPGVQSNDTNPGGGTLTSTVVTQPAHGSLTFNPNGSFTYVPTAGFAGSDSFTYQDSNGSATSGTATVTFNVTAVAPVANSDTYSTPENATLTIAAPGVQSNDNNPGGGTLTSTVVTQPAHGTLTFNPNGSFSYVPTAGFAGSDSFSYQDSNGSATSGTATVTVNVTAVAPVANSDTYSTPEGATLTVSAPGVQSNDNNPGGGTLTSTVVTQPAHGTLTFNPNGSFTYVPTSGYTGSDSFTYHDSNGSATSTNATVTFNVTPVAPTANSDTYSTPQGATLTVTAPGVQGNDTNPGGGTLTSVVVTQPSHGTLTFDPSGSFTYVPTPGFAGSDSFTYQDTNGSATSTSATVTFSVTPVAPVANSDTFSTPEGTILTVSSPGVQGNDTNPGGGTLTSTIVTQPSHGTVTLNPNGSLTYTPTPGFAGSDSFSYQDTNGTSTSNTATVTFNVTAVAPVANNDAYSMPENSTLTVSIPGVQSNDTNPGGGTLTSTILTQPAHGTVALSANGSFVYTPTTGFTGTDSFTYQDSNGSATSNAATVSLAVTATVSPAPVANNDTFSVPEGATLTVNAPGVQGNDTNPGGGALTSTVVTQPAHGTLTFNGNGSLVYTPAPGFTGSDSFTYQDTNGTNTSNTATVSFNVTPVVPVANNDNFSVPEGATLTVNAPGVQGNDNNPGGGTLTSTVVTQPAHGTLTFNANGSLVYSPTPGFVGADSFTYRDTDGTSTSNTATVTFNVTPVVPVANNDNFSVPEGATLTVNAPGVQGNDNNPGGGALTSTALTQPSHGALTFNANGSLVYTPTAGFVGSDSFTYRDTDGTSTSNTATVTFNITPVAPVANNDTFSTPEGTILTVSAPGVQGNDNNPGGGTLTSTIVTQPSHGTVVLNPNGSLTYTPTPGFAGSDSFSYQDTNGTSTSNTATVTFNVTAVAPVANNDAYSTPENATLTIAIPGVQGNDSNPGGGTLTSTILTQPSHGTVTLNPNGSFSYIPTTGFSGTDSFTYQDSNGSATSNAATVSLSVSATVSPAPVANNDAFSMPEGATLTVTAPGVQGNDTNPGGGTLTSTVITQPSHGTLTFNGNGSFVYAPAPGFTGSDSFTYQDNNGTNTSNTATVTLAVAPVTPVANNDAFSAPENTTLTVNAPGVQANDNNPGGGTLTSTVITQPAHGTVTFNANGSFVYTPTAGFVGSDSFTYNDTSGPTTSNTATVSLTVTSTGNQAPVANNDVFSSPEGSTLTVSGSGVQANDSNPGGGTLTSTVITQPSHGTLTFNPNGTFTYAPAAGFSGTDSFTYQDTAGSATSNSATVTLNVSPVAPVASSDTFSTPQGSTLTVSAPGVQGNDSNPGGGTLISTVVTQPAHGTLTFNNDGSFTYVPTVGFVGTDSFSYHDTDGTSTSNSATVSVSVTPVVPVANNDAYSTSENATLTVTAPGVQSNDTNPGGGTLTSTVVTQPAHGTLTFNPNGSFTYVPTTGYIGSDSFTYHDTNGTSTSGNATVTFNVTSTGSVAPVANNDAFSAPENTTLTVNAPGVQANDTNPGAGTLTSTVLTNPAHGSLTFNPNGSFTYIPAAGFVGSDSFTYQDTSGGSTSNPATVTLNVTSTPAPVANNDAFSTLENTTLTVAAPGVVANDSSPTGNPLTATVVTNPAHGTVTFNPNGSFTYVPTTGFVGSDSFTYHDSDGNNTSNVATVTVNVAALSAPVASNDTFSLPQDTTLTVASPGIQANDTDPRGAGLTSTVVTNPTHGVLTFNPDGSFTYVPTAGFVGSDSFTYSDNDGTNTSNTATVTLNVTPPANQLPLANDDAYSMFMGSTLTVGGRGIQANDNNPGGGNLTSNVITNVKHGTLTFHSDGSFTYVPAPGFAGVDQFTYEDSNGSATSNTALVTLNVAPIAPVANVDAYTVGENSTLNVSGSGVQFNDVNIGGGTLTSTLVNGPANGLVTFNPNGSFTYVPNFGFAGTDTFTYKDSNGPASSNVATVVITVTLPPIGPQVADLQRFGFHEQKTLYVVTFTEALNPALAVNKANYVLRNAGNKRLVYKFASVTYNAAAHTVTLVPKAFTLPLRTKYILTVKGSGPGGLVGADGIAMNAAAVGQPGKDYVKVITQLDLAGPSNSKLPKKPAAQAHAALSHKAVDSVLASAHASLVHAKHNVKVNHA